jgi:hypothetical protein
MALCVLKLSEADNCRERCIDLGGPHVDVAGRIDFKFAGTTICYAFMQAVRMVMITSQGASDTRK